MGEVSESIRDYTRPRDVPDSGCHYPAEGGAKMSCGWYPFRFNLISGPNSRIPDSDTPLAGTSTRPMLFIICSVCIIDLTIIIIYCMSVNSSYT